MEEQPKPVQILLPASKSLANRWLIINHLLGGIFNLQDLGEATDTLELQKALAILQSQTVSEGITEINAGSGGTGFRFLMAVLSLKPGKYFLYGSEQIMNRPHHQLIQSLQSLGSSIEEIQLNGKTGFVIEGKAWTGSKIHFKESISSQYISALALAAIHHHEAFTLELNNDLPSLPYLEMTLSCLSQAGIEIKRNNNSITIFPSTQTSGRKVQIERDWSSAAFFFAYPAGNKNTVIFFPGLKQDSLQGDKVIMKMAESWGVKSKPTENGIIISTESDNSAKQEISFNFLHCPDLFPATLTAFIMARKKFKAKGIQHLVHKESNRLEAMKKIAQQFGFSWKQSDQELIAEPIQSGFVPNQPIIITTFHDHRIAMCGMLLKSSFKNLDIRVDDLNCISKSFPGFLTALSSMENREG